MTIINDNENTVKVDGKTYAKGETVKVITTDAKGFATTGADTLPYGDYIIRETKTNGSYPLPLWPNFSRRSLMRPVNALAKTSSARKSRKPPPTPVTRLTQ